MSSVILDLKKGFKNYNQWFYLSYLSIKRRYAMSIIGPNWTLIANTFFILSVSFLFSGLNQKVFSDYFVFLCFGYLIWTYIIEFVNSGNMIFLNQKIDISNGAPNLTGLVLKFTFMQMLLFAHNLPLIIITLFFVELSLWGCVLAFFAFVIITINMFLFLIWAGTLCARFRDVSLLIATIMRIMFFLTPIIWHPDTAVGTLRNYFVIYLSLIHI